MEANPLDQVYAQLIANGLTPEQIEAFTIKKFVDSGKSPNDIALLASEAEKQNLQQNEATVPDITQPLSDEALDTLWAYLNDGKAEPDYAVPLAKALQAVKDKNLADFAKAAASLFKSMRKRTPHLEGN